MNIAIVDDEVHCIESLVIHIETLFPKMNITYKSNQVQEALTELPKQKIDLLFLDVQMPGLNGFQLLDQLPKYDFDVIFTTAYSQYAIQAFKAKAINYLLKPIDEDELKTAVTEWKEDRKKRKGPEKQLEHLFEYLKKEGILKSKISVPISDGYEFIEVKDIIYCQSQSNYTTFILTNNQKIVVSKTLKEVEHTLDRFFFIRIHQSYLINPNHLKKFHRKQGGYLIMQNDDQVPIRPQKRQLIIGLFEAIRKEEV